MSVVVRSLALAIGQLSDRPILKILLKSLAITIAIFIMLGLAFWWLLDAAINAWLVTTLPDNYSGTVAGIAAVMIGILAGWLLFRVVALAVMQFFADEVVQAVEARHYPDCAATARKLPFREDLSNSLRGVGRALLFNALALPIALILLFTAIGPAIIFLLVNAVLLGRELTDMGWFRHRPSPDHPSPVDGPNRVLLGGAIAGLMAIPFANLLAPIIGAAAGTHLVQLCRKELPKES